MIKIAKPFVDAIGTQRGRPRELLAGILALSRHMELTTVAEGIERPAQRRVLIDLDCDLGQGYLLQRPLDATATGQLLASERTNDDDTGSQRSGSRTLRQDRAVRRGSDHNFA